MPEPDGDKACDEVLERYFHTARKDSEMAVSSRYQVIWSNLENVRLDTKRIKEERPEIYKDFLNVTASRRFTVKVA